MANTCLLLILSSLFIATLATPTQLQCDEYLRPNPMRVQGQAAKKLPPELISISFSIQTIEQDASSSLQKNSEILDKAIKNIKALGVTEQEISTTGLSIQPSYEYNYDKRTGQSKSVFKGYQVNDSLLIKSKLTQSAGAIIDAGVKAGVNNVNYVQFQAKPASIKNAQDELISEAVLDAKKKAELALDPLKYKISGIKQVELSGDNMPQENRTSMKNEAASFDGASSNTQVFQSDQKVSLSVFVTFMIAEK